MYTSINNGPDKICTCNNVLYLSCIELLDYGTRLSCRKEKKTLLLIDWLIDSVSMWVSDTFTHSVTHSFVHSFIVLLLPHRQNMLKFVRLCSTSYCCLTNIEWKNLVYISLHGPCTFKWWPLKRRKSSAGTHLISPRYVTVLFCAKINNYLFSTN